MSLLSQKPMVNRQSLLCILVIVFSFKLLIAQESNGQKMILFAGDENVNRIELIPLLKSRFSDNLKEEVLIEDCRRIEEYYEDEGFLETICEYELIKTGDKSPLRVVFSIDKGELFRFGNITVEGNKHVNKEFIFGRLKFKSGSPFTKKSILSSQVALMKNGLFDDVEVLVDRYDHEQQVISVKVSVKERKKFYTDLGTGIDTEDGWRNFIGWGNRNFDGYGKQLNFSALHALDYAGGLYFKKGEITGKYVDPALYSYKLRFDWSISYLTDRPKGVNFGFERYRSIIGFHHLINDLSQISYNIVFEKNNLFEVEFDENDKTFRDYIGREENRGLDIIYTYDSRDNYLDPYEGQNLEIRFKNAFTVFGGDNTYGQVDLKQSCYLLIGSQFVLANRISVSGQFFYGNQEELPSYMRLYLGGSTSLRGYSESSVGPKNDDGSAQGGYYSFVDNIEMRYYLSYNTNIVLFMDTGNLWLAEEMIKLNTLKYTTGLGLRVHSRFGLFRLDYGVRITDFDQNSPGRLHFGFGQAF
ncbi:MAG: outer membrane protein assembly factor [Calditrichaceae bacterium]